MDIEFTIPIYVLVPLVVLSVIAWVLVLKWQDRKYLKKFDTCENCRKDISPLKYLWCEECKMGLCPSCFGVEVGNVCIICLENEKELK